MRWHLDGATRTLGRAVAEYELTQQGVELAEQWLDALRARRRLDDLLVELLEGGLAELKRNDV